jgi:hypothetical protein
MTSRLREADTIEAKGKQVARDRAAAQRLGDLTEAKRRQRKRS